MVDQIRQNYNRVMIWQVGTKRHWNLECTFSILAKI